MTDFVCIGVPYYVGEQPSGRTEVADIQASGIASELNAPWIDVQADFASSINPISAINKAIVQAIAKHPQRVPLIFAGDCCCALGAMKGLEQHQPAILWYDAHGDFNTPETSPSGFLGGMPLAWLVGRGDKQYMQDLDLAPIAENKVTITDARDLDPGEAVNLAASKVAHLKAVEDLSNVAWNQQPLYIHFDTDIVDNREMPAISYPAPGGPSIAQTAASMKHVAENAQVVGALFSLWNNTLPGAEDCLKGTLTILRALAAGLG